MGRKLFVQGPGLQKVKVVEVRDDANVAELIRSARDAGITVDEANAVVLIEDNNEPLAHDTLLDDVGLGDKASVHIGRCRKIDVSVRYGREIKTQDFTPSQRLRHVMQWATGNRGFDISKGDAQDLVLVVPGQQQPVDLDDHVGLFVRGDSCEARLDLVPSERIQG